MKALTLDGIGFSYPGGTAVFSGLSLEIEAGNVTVLLGPNGSGKSTLLGLLLGYLQPDSGTVSILERDLGSYHRTELGRIAAFVSQSAALPFNYPVVEYIMLGRTSHIPFLGTPGAGDLDAARRAAEAAGIGELLERNVQELSSGEMQLVSIARALAQEPRILLLDEPTSHLDPAHALRIFNLMRRLKQQGLSILFTTHDPLHARQVADQAVLLKQGELLFSGAVGEGLSAENLSRLYDISFTEIRQGDIVVPLAGIPGHYADSRDPGGR